MSGKSLCIHGHFYQPPRMDPWMDKIFPEGSAAPYRHWNERICRESYAPLAWARRADTGGRVLDIVNCYEWMSFNFGPTLISWMERSAPDTYARLLEADRKSLERWGHGNAMAQIYHHVIMPLASQEDKEAEVAWAVSDFEARFRRPPEGMWLSEAAVDLPTLEVLAAAGISFTILAPRQARAVSDLDRNNWRQVAEWEVDIREPYRVDLPGGKSMAVFFYNGPISQAVAFEGLLADGERFWSRLSGACSEGLLSLATDGETYGHHFAFGEMALAHVLDQGRGGRDGVRLTNFGAYLAENPPRKRVLLWETSSWSCVHGVERWRSDCGCSTGGHPGWNQRWRKPLREALDFFAEKAQAHFQAKGQALFKDPRKTLLGYGRVLGGLMDQDSFAAVYFKPRLSRPQEETAWKLLAMRKWGLASLASCAWFFDDLGRIEPLNAMTFALRAMELAEKTGAGNLESSFVEWLAEARSNDPDLGTGRDLWEKRIKRRQETPHQLTAQALLGLAARGRLPEPGAEAALDWPGVGVTVSVSQGQGNSLSGEARASWTLESGADVHAWSWTLSDPNDLLHGDLRVWPHSGAGKARGGAVVLGGLDQVLSWKKLQDIALAFIETAEEASWDQQLAEARRGLEFFLPYEEAQCCQTYAGKWRRFWAALCWRFVVDGAPDCPGMQDLLEFLRRHGPEHTDREMLLFRIKNRLMALLDQAEALPRIQGILGRMGGLGLDTAIWEVQNKYWTHREERRGTPELERLLGFSVQE